ncbi:MAG: anaerobic ribonucleoside-triphosphate reductase activating protein [Prevotella sp.]|nr:anaerobic ribonucleoside-triphosphate reductase activating protein [Staphylococcus sp.]MCM1349669.1 anaerobic ribonucleoside-triphosphate reductase activating protein [Prevotella sp.]
MKIRLAGEIEESIVDGPGIRYVVFTQGCPHHCKGCHNPETHDFNQGNLVDVNALIEKMKKYPYMSGLTISGGEPFVQSPAVLELIRAYQALYPRKNILLFTGYTYEELCAFYQPEIDEILSRAHYLIDGRFVLDKRDISLVYRGSTNQRIIDLQATRAKGSLVEKYF